MAGLTGFEVHPEGEDVRIRLEGELDYRSMPEARKLLLQTLDLWPGAVHLDLQGISFMDCHGLFTIAKIAKRLWSEKRVVACVANDRLAKIFQMAQIAPMLNVKAAE